MRADRNRKPGYYWVRFEGAVCVAEYTATGRGCEPEGPHWHVPGSSVCWPDKDVCELLSAAVELPAGREPEALYLAWHDEFRDVHVPWSTLSRANRDRWTALFNRLFQKAPVAP